MYKVYINATEKHTSVWRK